MTRDFELGKKIIALGIIFSIIFSMFTGFASISFGQTSNKVDVSMQVLSDNGEISNGEKGIDYKLSYMNLLFSTEFNLVDSSKLNDIYIVSNGRHIENEKFEMDYTNGVIALTLKDGPPNETNMDPYRLRTHSLYNIYIPEGTLVNAAGDYNKAIYHTFVTKAESGSKYEKDVLVQTNPEDKEYQIDYQSGKIEFEFVDNISLVPDFQTNIGKHLEVMSEPIDSSIPSYNMPPSYQYEESIDNFNVSVSNNKLVLQHKNGALKDFAKYTIKLEDNSLFLKNSEFLSSPNAKIFNSSSTNKGYEEIIFYTDNMLKSTTPTNNQENVEVEPTISFEFKYPVEIVDKSKVTISSDGMAFVLDNEDIYLTTKPGTDNKVLVLNINDHEVDKIFPLRRHTVYKVTIDKGAVKFKDYLDTIENKPILNKEINLHFITRGVGESPMPTAYSSTINKTDDIRYLDHEDKDIVLSGDKVTNLSTDGSIYIHFDRPIREDKQSDMLSLEGATKLYKIPKAEATKYNDKGKVYDEKVTYNLYDFVDKGTKIFPRDTNLNQQNIDHIIDEIVGNTNTYDIDKFKILEDLTDRDKGKVPLFMDEIPVGKVEIISSNILKVTPKYQLEASNKYGLWIDKRVIEDVNRFNMEENLKLNFWTKADNKNTSANWLKPESTKAESIKENLEAPYKSYTLFGVPQYGPTVPMVLDLDNEVIPRAQDEVLEQTPDDVRNTRRISYDALKEISLVDVYPTSAKIKEVEAAKEAAKAEAEAKGEEFKEEQFDLENPIQEVEINKYEFFYYFENGIKKTKIHLYPNQSLERGKNYQLIVPNGALETRSGNPVKTLDMNFVVEGEWEGGKGAYTVTNNQAKLTDLWLKGEWDFSLYGHNFHEKVDKVELVPMESTTADIITIDKKDIEFRSVTELKVKLRGENAKKLSTETYTGRYSIILYFEGANGLIDTNLYFNVISKSHPLVLKKEPEGDVDKWYDENILGVSMNPKTINGVERYFLKVTFEDIDGKLDLNTSSDLLNLSNSEIVPSGLTTNYLDTELIAQLSSNSAMISEYIFNKDRVKREAYLFIPVKLLQPQITYEVNISSGVVRNDSAEGNNNNITWKFTTMAIPSVTDKDIIVQSVTEDYDEYEPLIIYGDFFYSSTIDVYFNNEGAYRVVHKEDNDGKKYLEVYLPRGRNQLKPGLYDISIENGRNHQKITHGTLSVVPEGQHIPQDGKRIKESNRREEVVEVVSRSEDVLSLNRYSSNSSIELNLDELMGRDTLVRKIEFSRGNSSSIKELLTYSKWANVNIYDININASRDQESYIYVGRVEAFLAENFKKTLQKNHTVKSEMIQVIGNNANFIQLYIELPYEIGVESNFKVLRYDETSRKWTEEVFYLNKADQRAIVRTFSPGIFVIVEPKN